MEKLYYCIEDMADVCELAHDRTVQECAELGINVNCDGIMDCTDGSQEHDGAKEHEHYGALAGEIFEKHYRNIIQTTGI